MILHIIPDEKFTDAAISLFEKAAPDNNRFLVTSKNKKLKYTKAKNVETTHQFVLLKKSFIQDLKNYDFVVLHYLDDLKMNLIYKAADEVKFLWIGWGGDYYNYLTNTLLFDKTLNIKNMILKKNKTALKQKLRDILFYKVNKNKDKILNRIDYFAPVLEEEYIMMKKLKKNFKAKYIDWNYGNLEDDMIKTNEAKITGNNILLGNSATFENNHVEALNILKNIDLTDRKIIMPLSYGNIDYKDYLVKYCKKIDLDTNILTDFIPIDEYNKIISSCSVVIMNHIRQQALGNIIIMMYYGAKIFLNRENPVYNYFKKLGSFIYSIEELNEEAISTPLQLEEVEKNRKILENEWNRDRMVQKTKILTTTITEQS